MDSKDLVLNIIPRYRTELEELPWNLPLSKWSDKKIKFIHIRKGISKHTVRFIKTKSFSFAIKQTSPISAYFETETYEKLLKTGVHTLIPAGYVIYKKNLFEKDSQLKSDSLAFMITIVEDKTIPHSILFKLDFNEDNRQIIYEAIAELLANLHIKNIYWGDASLANSLIKFIKLKDEKGKAKTELKAFLSDAETIEILDKISDEKREKDLKHLVSSMIKLNKKFIAEGIIRKQINIDDDINFVSERYESLFSLMKKIKEFESKTGLNTNQYFYTISDEYSIDSILKQIEEHKWYLSESSSKEVSLKESAEDWIKNVYQPIIDEFDTHKVFDYFPDTNSSKLYTDIMAHKYYLSLEEGKDVGVFNAIKSYAEKYSYKEGSVFQKLIEKLLGNILKVVPQNYTLLTQVSE